MAPSRETEAANGSYLLIHEEQLLIDIGCMEPVAVHGLLGLVNLGETFLTCYFRWRPVRSDGALLVREKVLAHVIARPRGSVTPGGDFDRWLSAQLIAANPIEAALALLH